MNARFHERRRQAYDDYQAGKITREEWYRKDPFATAYYDDFRRFNHDDAEGRAIRMKLDQEYREEHDRQQLASMEYDIQRGRGHMWEDHRLWDKRKRSDDRAASSPESIAKPEPK